MAAEADVFNLVGDDEDEEDDETFQRQVLFVPDFEENEDLSTPPMDGFQFLKRVVAERERCEAVVTKKVETKPLKNLAVTQQIPEFPEEKCNPEFYLDKETQLHIISEFSKLRSVYEARKAKIPREKLKELKKAIPGKKDEAQWLKVFSSPLKNFAETVDSQDSSVNLCLAISQAKIASVLDYVGDWLEEGELSVPTGCQWLHTLLACVALPLDPDVCAALRTIARALIARRARLESVSCEELPHINLVICIIGRYFNQFDLADPMD